MKRNYLNTFLFVFVISVIVCSCSPFKPALRVFPEGRLPETFSLYSSSQDQLELWWEEFDDSELNALIEESLSENFTIKKAWTQLRRARSVAIQAGAALYPELSGTAGASYSHQRGVNESSEGGSTQNIRDFSLGCVSAYELDLWGKIRSEREAERLEVTATHEDLNAAAMTLAAEVADRWVNVISQRMQKQLLERQLKTNKTYLELVDLRFRKSLVSALDVYQQRQIVEQIQGKIPLVEAQEQLFMHELSLLLGKIPGAVPTITRDQLPLVSEIPHTGLPADLLSLRPDIRAAGFRLKAADWKVAAARADRLPSIRLTAEAIYGADELELIFDNWLLNLAGNLTAPIFDGRRRSAEVDRTRAVADENLIVYQETVYTALKEVEDALVNEEKQREHIKALQEQLDTARQALEQAGVRYRKGLNDYLPVLTQLLSVQDLEQDLIQRQAELIIDRVTLYRALGGTWTDDLVSDEGLQAKKGTSNIEG